MNKKLNLEKDQLETLYQTMTDREISEHLGVSPAAIWQYRQRFGIPSRPRRARPTSKPPKIKKYPSADNRKSQVRKWDCICPKCGVKHRVKMFWTGRGTPRKFCESCNKVKPYLGAMPEYEDTKSGFYRMAVSRSVTL